MSPTRNLMMTPTGEIVQKPPLRCVCATCGADLALAVRMFHERPRGEDYEQARRMLSHCLNVCDSLNLQDIKIMADKMGLDRWPEA